MSLIQIKTTFAAIVVVNMLLAQLALADSLPLVESGRTAYRIHAGEKPDSIARHGIRELNQYFEQIAGTTFATTDQPEGKLIVLGTLDTNPLLAITLEEQDLEALAALSSQGFLLKQHGDHLVIAGGGPLGLLYGVYELLEQVGVRWYMPGDLGEVVPETETVILEDLDITAEPSYRVRSVWRGRWALRNKMNVRIPNIDGVSMGEDYSAHNFYQIVPETEYYALHPQYFGWDGEQRKGWRQQSVGHSRDFCTSNPEVRNLAALHLIREADAEPHRQIFPLKSNDGRRVCECSRCTSLDEPDAEWSREMARRYALFTNAVAERFAESHPEKLINFLAYSFTTRAPFDEIPMHPNVLIEITNHRPYADHNHPIQSPASELTSEFLDIVATWRKRAEHLGLYEYYYRVGWVFMPMPVLHVIREDIPWFHAQGGTFFHTQARADNFGNLALNYYLAAKLTWDVNADVDQILDEFHASFYGSAAEAMRRYHDRLQAAMKDYGGTIEHFGMRETMGQAINVFTPEVLADAEEELEHARTATDDPTILARIELSQISLDYTTLVVDYLSHVHRNVVAWDVDPEWQAVAREKAGRIRDYIKGRQFPEQMNLKAFLPRVQSLILNQHELPSAFGIVERDKTEWISEVASDHVPPTPGEQFDLIIQGWDLDSTSADSISRLYLHTPAGERREVGWLPSKGMTGGSNASKAFITEQLDWSQFAGSHVTVEIYNPPETRWTNSYIQAIYIVPTGGWRQNEIDQVLEQDRNDIREQSYGFVEYSGKGVQHREGERLTVEIKIHAGE